MSPELSRFLTASYRRDILGESVEVELPGAGPDLIAEARERLAAIDGLRLGSHLINRAFDLYQEKRTLETFLAQLEAQDATDGQGQ